RERAEKSIKALCYCTEYSEMVVLKGETNVRGGGANWSLAGTSDSVCHLHTLSERGTDPKTYVGFTSYPC
ncbi:hypothetical protein P3E18_26415, partial [Pseudomonas aeruginosa]